MKKMNLIFGPSGLILLAAILAAIGALWSSQKQSEFEGKLNLKNEQIISLQRDTIGHLTGGNSVPYVSSQNDFILRHHSGEYPLFDLNIIISEYWHPSVNEALPDGFWDTSNGSHYPKVRIVVEKKIDKLLPGQTIPLGKASIRDALFPQTKKVMYRIKVSTRSGHFDQQVSFGAYGSGDKDYWLTSELLRFGDGREIYRTGYADWIKRQSISDGIHSMIYLGDGGDLFPVWPETLPDGRPKR